MTPKLEQKYRKYLELLPEQQEPRSGFIEHRHCDSVMFSGFIGSVPGVKVDLIQAFNEKKGTWHRKPLHMGECYNANHPRNLLPFRTRLFNALQFIYQQVTLGNNLNFGYIGKKILFKENSTISRDMLTGIAFYAWYNKRPDIAESVIHYAMNNWGIMGEGDLSRLNIMPNLFSTYCWISYKLGGPSRPWARWLPADANVLGVTGFRAHLQVMHILLRQDITGKKFSKGELRVLNHHADRQPRNALFQAAAGRFEEAIRCLEDETIYPQDRLPTQADRYEPWITIRDADIRDWAPTNGVNTYHTHSGGDFLFDFWMLKRMTSHGRY